MSSDIKSIISMTYLTPENIRFAKSANGFISAAATAPNPLKDGEVEAMELERVFLHRAFPFGDPDLYISVQAIFHKDGKTHDEDGKRIKGDMKEVGMIGNIADFDPETQEILRAELGRKYYCPTIKTISSIKERYGYSYWVVDTDMGDISFGVYDTFRSIQRISDDRLVINDIDGNKYDIPSLEALDKRSFKKIELYL